MSKENDRRSANSDPAEQKGGGVAPRTSHSPYTAAVQRALITAGHAPDLVHTLEEQGGLRRSLVRVSTLRLLWKEEHGWSATTSIGQTWACPHGVVAAPEQVAAWVGQVLAGTRPTGGGGPEQKPSPLLEEALASYVDPVWLAGPPAETDPAWH